MDIDKCIDGEEIERVSNFEYLGARIEANGKNTPEIRRRLAMATTRLTKMISIWKGQCKKTKLRVLETVVFPTALYGCEAWTINNTDAKRITSFEMKCYRKILRISWMEKVTNKEVLSRLDIKTTMLLQTAKTLKLKYFGHIKRHETLERHILEARIDGRRGRGRPTRRWEQDINDWMDMTTTQAGRLAEDRILFRQKVQEATTRQEISWSREREWVFLQSFFLSLGQTCLPLMTEKKNGRHKKEELNTKKRNIFNWPFSNVWILKDFSNFFINPD